MLGRLRVGTKLLLLVVVPVCVLLGFTVLAARSEWRHAGDLRRFRARTDLSFATARLADALATERLATVLRRLPPQVRHGADLAAAQRRVDAALRRVTARVATSRDTLDLPETVDAARRQVQALRARTDTSTRTAQAADQSYSRILDNLYGTLAGLEAVRPTAASDRATSAYLSCLLAVEAAEREQIDVGQSLVAARRGFARGGDAWQTVERSELEAFRRDADPRLTGELDALLFQPASLAVQEVRDRFTTSRGVAGLARSPAHWLSVSGARVRAMRHLEGDTAGALASTISGDLRTADANATRDLALSLAVLLLVTGLGLALRRSITRPLDEVSAGARALSGGDLNFAVGYAGRDEIGDVSAALSELRAVAERLAEEIRAMNAAIGDSRLDHRADVSAFGGTWSQLLAGMNDTVSAFAALHDQEAALRRVATLVARGVAPDEIFSAVVAETRELLSADAARLMRYEADETVMVVAASDPGMELPVGTRLSLEGESLASLLRRTGRPASMPTYDDATGPTAALVRSQGIKASCGAPVVVEGRMWGLMVALWSQPPRDPSSAEGRMAQFTELIATAIANAHSSAQLSASRARVVAAADDARRRIERDLHDGVQQRLVTLGLELRNAEATLPAGASELRGQIERVVAGLNGAFEELRAVSHGIHPAILSLGGLGPALGDLARRAAVPVELDLQPDVELPDRAEVAVYYVVSETLTNVAKHADATEVRVRLTAYDGVAALEIRDDGVGGADSARGSGLIGLADRVEAIGGTIAVTSPTGGGTAVHVRLPVAGGDSGA